MATWLFVIGILLYFLIVGCSCNDDILPPQKPVVIQLSADDVGVTEAWIKVTTNDAKGTFALKRDSITVAANLHSPIDTVIYDAGLLPNHTYNYFADTDTPLTITTMDTTSHDFSWEDYLYGDNGVGTSYLSCVDFINENNVWAGGEIFVKDSVGNYRPPPYNLVKCENRESTLETIFFNSSSGPSPSLILTIFAFGENNVVASSGINVRHWNGLAWSSIGQFFIDGNVIGDVSSIWGKSYNNFYGVGRIGSILHWDGIQWNRHNSNTNATVTDIYGYATNRDTSITALCTIYDPINETERKVVKIKNTGLSTLDETNHREITSIWAYNGHQIYACGYDLYEYKNNHWKTIDLGLDWYLDKVRGSGPNNIFVISEGGEIMHFNGITWKSVLKQPFHVNYYGMSVIDNAVAIVGHRDARAIMSIGKRN